MFAPLKTNLPVPDPSLVKDPAALIVLLTVILPAADIPKVMPLVLVNAPVWKVNVPAAVLLILEALKTFIGPDIVALDALIILIAPGVAAKPVPLIEISSGIVIAPLTSNAAPDSTTVIPEVLPSAEPFVACITPVFIVVIPVYVLVPPNTKAPAPSLVTVNELLDAAPEIIFDTVSVVPVATTKLIKLVPKAIPVPAVLKVNVPTSVLIFVFDDTVTGPVIILSDEIFLITPSLLIPLPEIVMGSAAKVTPP